MDKRKQEKATEKETKVIKIIKQKNKKKLAFRNWLNKQSGTSRFMVKEVKSQCSLMGSLETQPV